MNPIHPLEGWIVSRIHPHENRCIRALTGIRTPDRALASKTNARAEPTPPKAFKSKGCSRIKCPSLSLSASSPTRTPDRVTYRSIPLYDPSRGILLLPSLRHVRVVSTSPPQRP